MFVSVGFFFFFVRKYNKNYYKIKVKEGFGSSLKYFKIEEFLVLKIENFKESVCD